MIATHQPAHPMKLKTFKTAKTTKPYTLRYSGWTLTVPAGSAVSNRTACGFDDSYRFWQDFAATAKQVTGCDRSILHHDLTYYGLNIPAEFCEHYQS